MSYWKISILMTNFICYFSLLSTSLVSVGFTTTEHASTQKVVQPLLKFCGIYKWIKSNHVYWFPVNSYSSQLVLKSTRTHFGQFLLIDLVTSYSFGQFVLIVWSIRTHFDQFVLTLVNSFSHFWSIRSHFGISILGYIFIGECLWCIK